MFAKIQTSLYKMMYVIILIINLNFFQTSNKNITFTRSVF